ncbi:MAG: DUF2278 family protein [Candidatus Obscuribacterales bacterium]|nr:DUF2278 family protein [Candidatus Obscuribacterales bacterium]
MPIQNYGVVVGHITADDIVVTSGGPHAHVPITAACQNLVAAVNVESNTPAPGKNGVEASEVLFYIQENYVPANATALQALGEGVHHLHSAAGGAAIDMDLMPWLVTQQQMTLLPLGASTPTILHTQLDTVLKKAIQSTATVYIFGQLYAGGVHDVHKNEGNVGRFSGDNGSYQDGAIFIEWGDGTWTTICIAFQTQVWA